MIQIGHFELIYVDGALPKRFAKLDVHSMQRWYILGADTHDGSTHQLSKAKMSRLLRARRLLEGGSLVDAEGNVTSLDDREWVLGRGADVPIGSVLTSPTAARARNGQNHVAPHWWLAAHQGQWHKGKLMHA